MAMFTHVTIGTNDLVNARSFYDNVLGTLGYKRLTDLGDGGSIWGESGPEFFVLKPANGQPACFANGGTISFTAPNRAAVAAFHKTALAAGEKMKGPSVRAIGRRTPTPLTLATSTETRSRPIVSGLSDQEHRNAGSREDRCPVPAEIAAHG